MTEPLEPGPPQSREAEESVLGSCLIDSEAFPLVADRLSADDFYTPQNAAVYRAMKTIHERGQPTDFLMVCDEMRNDKDSIEFLGRLLSVVPTADHVMHYAGIVSRCAFNRRVITAAGHIAAEAYKDMAIEDTASAVHSIVQNALRGAERGTNGPVALSTLMGTYLESVGQIEPENGPLRRIPTGFADLDRLVGGFARGDLIILAARPSLGKTSLGLNVARNVGVRFGGRVLLFSIEMSASLIAQRFLTAEAGIETSRILEGRLSQMEVGRLALALDTLSVPQIWVDNTSGIRLALLMERARRLHSEHPLDLVIVDYIGLIENYHAGRNMVQEVGDIAKSLKSLAGEMNVPVLALCQLSRGVEQRAGHTPMLSDLRDSGNLEEHADVAAFLSRHNEDGELMVGRVGVHVLKSRNGPCGDVELAWDARTTRFGDIVGGGS